MKFGFRTPSIKRSISARTTGRAKRAIKRAIIPGYGRKGMGFLGMGNNPMVGASVAIAVAIDLALNKK